MARLQYGFCVCYAKGKTGALEQYNWFNEVALFATAEFRLYARLGACAIARLFGDAIAFRSFD